MPPGTGAPSGKSPWHRRCDLLHATAAGEWTKSYYLNYSFMEMSPLVLVDKGSSATLQGHPEELAEAVSDRPGELGGPRPELTDLEEGSEDRGYNL
ncbi:unnamed protein product [Schistocephalus solidus]|uniref:Uncharacterized protein n=1 Tax=Schistocephalus solidus TaxID=70667 RepID=A0A183TER4_SCHSO|nr:unnamed protein product [Schistocephalus solidus]